MIAIKQTFLSKTHGKYFLGDWGLKCVHISVKLGVFLSLTAGTAPDPSNHAKKAMTGRYEFSNVKLSKMLCFFSVAEAHSLIYSRP